MIFSVLAHKTEFVEGRSRPVPVRPEHVSGVHLLTSGVNIVIFHREGSHGSDKDDTCKLYASIYEYIYFVLLC